MMMSMVMSQKRSGCAEKQLIRQDGVRSLQRNQSPSTLVVLDVP